MLLAILACFNLIAPLACHESLGPASRHDEALEIAIVGGGVAGTVTALELLRRNETLGSLTIFEHGPSIGHNKSASGIIAAILGFASTQKYWDEDIAFVKLKEFLALRPEVPSERFISFGDEWLHGHLFGDQRMQRETQTRFFQESRAQLEALLDAFPELCGAVVGPFCCREGSEARRWMESEVNQMAHNVSCERVSGVAHVFRAKNDAVCNVEAAKKQGLETIPSEAARTACMVDQANLTKRTKPSVDLLTMEQLMRQNLYAGLWSTADEGFVRVEDFYPIAQAIFERRGVRVHRSCSVRWVQPEPRRPSRQPMIRVVTAFSCLSGNGGVFDRVIVAAGANTANLLARHDRRIASQLVPVKGFAVKTDAPLFDVEHRQIGFEFEDLGHYIRAQANGGVRYGFGRELGTFQDQLLEPTFEGWHLGSGPNATRLGRQILARDHVGLAGFRPLSIFAKFPLIKRYTGQWSGLFVNTGFGFYGYGMAWKSAELTVDLVLGLQPKGWDGVWEVEEGPLICTRGLLQVGNVVFAGALLSLLFAAVVCWSQAGFWTTPHPQLDPFDHQGQTLLREVDVHAIAADRTYLNSQEPKEGRYMALIQQYQQKVISTRQFDEGRDFLATGTAQWEEDHPLLNEVEDFEPLDRILGWGECWVWVHFGTGILASVLAFFNLNSPVFLVMVAKAGWVVWLQFSPCSEMKQDLEKLRLSTAKGPPGLWLLVRCVLGSVDQELDGSNAGQALRLGSFSSGVIPSQVMWAKSHYQQQWQCVPFIGFLLAWLGPYDALTLHFGIFITLQALFSLHHMRKAKQELEVLRAPNAHDDHGERVQQWDEFWRRCVHAFDLSGLFVAKQITLARCDEASLAVRAVGRRAAAQGQSAPKYHGRYGMLTVFILKTALESGGSLVFLTTTAAVTLDFLTTSQVAVGVLCMVSSTYSILEGILFQLTHHYDIQANMTDRWYGWLGFIGNRIAVVIVGLILLFAWVKAVGLVACDSHVLDLTNGCVYFSSEQIYSLRWHRPGSEILALYIISAVFILVVLICFAVLALVDVEVCRSCFGHRCREVRDLVSTVRSRVEGRVGRGGLRAQ